MKMEMNLLLCLVALSFAAAAGAKMYGAGLLKYRGGLVPQASEVGDDYYEKFELDYGCEDDVRTAGSMRGFITAGKLSSLPEKDPFLKWVNEHLESGPEEAVGRIKPYYVSY